MQSTIRIISRSSPRRAGAAGRQRANRLGSEYNALSFILVAIFRYCGNVKSIQMYMTNQVVAFIRDAYLAESKHTPKCEFTNRFASYFNVHTDTISDIINYRTWRHVACELSEQPMEALRSFEELDKLDPLDDESVFMGWPSVF